MPPVMLSHKQRAPTPAREGAGTVIDGLGATTDTPPAKDLLPSGVVLAGQDALTVCCCLIATIMVAGLPPGDSAPGERAPLSPARRSATALSPKAPLKAWSAKPQDRHDPGRTLFELFLTSVSCPVRGLASALIVGCYTTFAIPLLGQASAPRSPARRSATALSLKAPLKAWTAKPHDRHDPGRTLLNYFSPPFRVRSEASPLP